MDNNKKETNEFKVEDRHLYSIAAILLLAPFVYFIINSKDSDISKNDKEFILWYIKYWLATLSIIIVWTLIYILSFTIWLLPIFFSNIAYLTLVIWIAWILAWIFMVFKEKRVFTKNIDIKYKKINWSTLDIVFNYIPWYNISIWYSNPDIKNYRWSKESFMLWFIWSIVSISTFNIFLSFFLLTLIILRAISLWAWIDVIKDSWKEKLDTLFNKNPEEIFSYIKWLIIFIYKKIKDSSLQYEIYTKETIKAKKDYQEIINMDKSYQSFFWENKNILAQYIILSVSILLTLSSIINFMQYNLYWNIILFALLFIIFRYWYLVYSKKLINIPILYEIVLLFAYLIKLINKK